MDPEFGNWQAKELTSHLEHVFCNLPIEIVRTKKSLEVLPNQLKKVKLVKLLVKSMAKKFPIDFIMYIGDDHGIEPVFTYLNNKKQQDSKLLTGVRTTFTMITKPLYIERQCLHLHHGKKGHLSQILLERYRSCGSHIRADAVLYHKVTQEQGLQ